MTKFPEPSALLSVLQEGASSYFMQQERLTAYAYLQVTASRR